VAGAGGGSPGARRARQARLLGSVLAVPRMAPKAGAAAPPVAPGSAAAEGAGAALLDKGLQLLAGGQEELAVKFFRKGLEVEPRNLELLKALGETLMEMGQPEEAKAVFRRSLEVEPGDYSLSMYLGQLEQGKEALAHYERGIQALRTQVVAAEVAGEAGAEEAAALGRELSCALCALAELYMSDLCFEADAEAQAERALGEAQTACSDNPQALQGMASFRLSQCRPQDAKPLVLRALAVIEGLMDRRDAIADEMADEMDGAAEEGEDGEDEEEEGAGLAAAAAQGAREGKNKRTASELDSAAMEEDEEAEEVAAGQMLEAMSPEEVESLMPPFEFRAATARILIECEEHAAAGQLLERLVAENDEIAEVWLLLAQCHMQLGATADAIECLERADELSENLLKFEPALKQDAQFMTMVGKIKALKATAADK
jgi:tetratricopeptide (TPR) repeat protein